MFGIKVFFFFNKIFLGKKRKKRKENETIIKILKVKLRLNNKISKRKKKGPETNKLLLY